MDTKDRLTRMCMRQHELNCLAIGADWMARKQNWSRAIWIEAGELMQHHGTWEWWKETIPDMPQVKLEMIDILHFGLSDMIQKNSGIDTVIESLLKTFQRDELNTYEEPEFLYWVEDMAESALMDRRFAVDSFYRAWRILGCHFPEMYRVYMGKAVLNKFRQDYGYKEGKYQKIWGGKEDNYHLVKITENIAPAMPDDEADAYIFSELTKTYYAHGHGDRSTRVVQR